MDMLKLCNKCKRDDEETFHGYIGWVDEECYECPICQNEMIDTILTIDEYNLIDNISDDISFLEAMIKLKQDDIIEYKLKLQQLKNAKEQEKQYNEKKNIENTNQPKCPICNSANIKKITSTERAISIVGLGIFSKKINKSYKCKNCGSTW